MNKNNWFPDGVGPSIVKAVLLAGIALFVLVVLASR